jgi:glyoxylase-like metal-dependent hydrolase (beta-lactamase superfamily II)
MRTRFEVGALTLDRVVESQFAVLEPAEVYPDSTPQAIADNLSWLAPRFYDPKAARLILAFQGFVVRGGGRTIVVDTCVGDCKHRRRPDFHRQSWGWLEKLRAVGVAPESVDCVVCTHFHVDHVGWNTRLEDGHWVPTFPNARYLIAKPEWDYWTSAVAQAALARTGDYMADSVLPVVDAGLADFVAPDHRIDAHTYLIPAPGHTPGMVLVGLESQGQRVVITGDLLHTVLQLAYPDWSTRFCADPAQSRATRRAFLESVADTDTLVVPAHFPAPTAGWVRRSGATYDFRFADSPLP